MGTDGFSVDWLRLREPYDHAARSEALVRRWAEALPGRQVTLLDLGCGLGSNLRFAAPRLDRPQHWLLADHDQALLDAQPPAPAGVTVERRCLDLDDATVPWPAADGLTTQALLDLVGVPWLERLVRYLQVHRVPLLAALSVDGRVGWHPSHPDDEHVMRAFRTHQLTDRGFGASLGPRAASWLAGRLSAAGYQVELCEADWQIPGSHAEMLRSMVSGIAGAAQEAGSGPLESWSQWRLQHTERLVVGHLELLAVPD
jgi:SAM-dependent methyltransferase